MFKSINLHATEDKLQQLVLTGLSPIKSFVRQLNFFPSPYIPGVTREKFEEMLRIHYSGFKFPSHCLRCRRIDDEHAEDPYIINDQCDMCEDMSSLMDNITGRNGDRLFEAVIRTLISTQLPVEELRIGCELENTFQPGWSDRSWHQLNLDKLQTIAIDTVPLDSEHHDCATRMCLAVIKKVQKTVQNITLRRGWSLHWADFEWPPELPSLRSIRLENVYLHAEASADAIGLSTRLNKLVLDKCHSADWRTIFDAVRCKPTSFDFECFDIRNHRLSSWTFNIKDKTVVGATAVFGQKLLQRHLYLYLMEGEEWTEYLEAWFTPPEV
ncbi:hypothetical protein LTR47_005501 [Exophiala xenobiotica]|nr:hypothetical protein LTR47_005501 [Exophiala xenobiotica]KAK5247093.1 hypothetical protein LTS06_007713 [Exophiala xenobiotica]KAK5365229.1 hypothetical protein LTR11_008639 [Exophiala xenobiotica]